MGFLIFEGCDLVGKSSLIEKMNLTKIKGNPNFSFQDWQNYISIISQNTYFLLKNFQHLNFALDRLAISDYVYNKVYSRNVDVSHINLKQDFKNSKIVYVTVSSVSILEKRYQERGDEKISFDKVKMLYEEYETFFKTFNDLPFIKIINDDFIQQNNNINLINKFWNFNE